MSSSGAKRLMWLDTVWTIGVVVCLHVTNCEAYFYVKLHMSHCYSLWWCTVVHGVPSSGWEVICSSSGYGYVGTRTDVTRRTNICLFTHRRHVWVHLIRHACQYVSSIATTLKSHAPCSGYLARLSARHRLASLAPDCRWRWHSSRIGFSVATDVNSNSTCFG
jgi:hypothetical protein